MLMDQDAIVRAAEIVDDSMFYAERHRRIFRSMVAITERGSVVDPLTLAEELSRKGELEAAGGKDYIGYLVDAVPTAANIEYHAEIVREKALLRSLIFTANKVLGSAYEADKPPADILRWSEQQFFDLLHGHVDGRMVQLKAGISPLSDDLAWRVQHRGELTGVTTGFPSIDTHTAGWQKGDLIVVAARPSIGKTTFVMNSVVAACRAGKRVAVFSLEMRRRQLEWRILSSLADVPMVRIRAGELGGNDYQKIAAAQ